jgi:hypothetical protein
MKSAIKVAYEESKLASGAIVDDSGELGVGYMAHSHDVCATSAAIVSDREMMSVGKTREQMPVALRRMRA